MGSCYLKHSLCGMLQMISLKCPTHKTYTGRMTGFKTTNLVCSMESVKRTGWTWRTYYPYIVLKIAGRV